MNLTTFNSSSRNNGGTVPSKKRKKGSVTSSTNRGAIVGELEENNNVEEETILGRGHKDLSVKRLDELSANKKTETDFLKTTFYMDRAKYVGGEHKNKSAISEKKSDLICLLKNNLAKKCDSNNLIKSCNGKTQCNNQTSGNDVTALKNCGEKVESNRENSEEDLEDIIKANTVRYSKELRLEIVGKSSESFVDSMKQAEHIETHDAHSIKTDFLQSCDNNSFGNNITSTEENYDKTVKCTMDDISNLERNDSKTNDQTHSNRTDLKRKIVDEYEFIDDEMGPDENQASREKYGLFNGALKRVVKRKDVSLRVGDMMRNDNNEDNLRVDDTETFTDKVNAINPTNNNENTMPINAATIMNEDHDNSQEKGAPSKTLHEPVNIMKSNVFEDFKADDDRNSDKDKPNEKLDFCIDMVNVKTESTNTAVEAIINCTDKLNKCKEESDDISAKLLKNIEETKENDDTKEKRHVVVSEVNNKRDTLTGHADDVKRNNIEDNHIKNTYKSDDKTIEESQSETTNAKNDEIKCELVDEINNEEVVRTEDTEPALLKQDVKEDNTKKDETKDSDADDVKSTGNNDTISPNVVKSDVVNIILFT
ncbi:hypothetical protein WDU94_003317 [Cyamophila willieti]